MIGWQDITIEKGQQLSHDDIVDLIGYVSGGSIKLAIVDDDDVYRNLVVRHAQKSGFVVEDFGTFADLADRLEKYDPDVILMDLNLDLDSGIDIAECLSEWPIVLVSRNLREISGYDVVPDNIKAVVHKKYGALTALYVSLKSLIKHRALVIHNKEAA